MNEELLKIPTLCNIFFRLLCFVCDLAPNVMMQISEQMLNAFVQCLNLALDNQFGSDRVKSALEIINNMTGHLCTQKQTLQFVQLFSTFTPVFFIIIRLLFDLFKITIYLSGFNYF